MGVSRPKSVFGRGFACGGFDGLDPGAGVIDLRALVGGTCHVERALELGQRLVGLLRGLIGRVLIDGCVFPVQGLFLAAIVLLS